MPTRTTRIYRIEQLSSFLHLFRSETSSTFATSTMAEDHQQKQPPIPTSQATLSSLRLQHFNYLSPASQHQPAPTQHYPSGPGPERRHYSFDTDTESQRYPAVDYDQTEGLGGVSVSSYDSIDDDRIDPAMRGYPYHGKTYPLFCYLAVYCSIV